MRTIALSDLHTGSPELHSIADALEEGRLVCMPHNAGYRLMADVTNQDAVNRLFQAKRRTKHAPSLVFIDSVERVHEVAANFSARAAHLASRFWPGPLTVLVRPATGLPKRVVKELSKANKHLGVRVPAEPLIREVVQLLGRPVLASSANRQKKAGESSAAAVRRFFGSELDLFVDAGDLDGQAPVSTVVNLDGDQLAVTRPGAVPTEALEAALAEAAA